MRLNKRGILIFTLFVVSISLFVIGADIYLPLIKSPGEIGYISEDEFIVFEENLSYSKVFYKELVEHRPVYDWECNTFDIFNSTSQKSEQIKTCSRVEVGFDPIYEESLTIALKYEGERYDFIDKGCSICNRIDYEDGKFLEGKLLLCLSNSDGYSSFVKECFIEEGTSYLIKDLDTRKNIENSGEFKVEI